jgi:type IV secretory pathway VirJ component
MYSTLSDAFSKPFLQMKNKVYLLSLFCVFFSMAVSAQKTISPDAYPLHVLQKTGAKQVVFFLTGDGGWNSFSQSLMAELGNKGYAVIALDTRNYFWKEKTPDQFGHDAEMMISYYLSAWNKNSFSIIGYSFGADVGAFLPNHISTRLSSKLKSVVLLSPGFSTGFVTKLSNMLGIGGSDNDKYKVYPELRKISVPVRCIFGDEEESDFYASLKATERIHKITIPGSHKYKNDTKMVVKAILPGL